MKAILLIGISILLALTVVGQNKIIEISELNGIAGCWERRDLRKSIFISEQWMKPAGTSILGMGRTVKNSKTTDWEFMRIEKRADGIFFVAQPKANSGETAFKLMSSTLKEVVFENKEHDFPQRVIYKFGGKTLTGRIEGNDNGKFMAFDFQMTRTKCE